MGHLSQGLVPGKVAQRVLLLAGRQLLLEAELFSRAVLIFLVYKKTRYSVTIPSIFRRYSVDIPSLFRHYSVNIPSVLFRHYSVNIPSVLFRHVLFRQTN